jgi:hypothetical protein
MTNGSKTKQKKERTTQSITKCILSRMYLAISTVYQDIGSTSVDSAITSGVGSMKSVERGINFFVLREFWVTHMNHPVRTKSNLKASDANKPSFVKYEKYLKNFNGSHRI